MFGVLREVRDVRVCVVMWHVARRLFTFLMIGGRVGFLFFLQNEASFLIFQFEQ